MVLCKRLKLYFYKLFFVNQLKLEDHSVRLDSALRTFPCQARMKVEMYCPLHILWRDKTHFHLVGAVNRQNNRIWGFTNPYRVQQQSINFP